MTDEQERAVFAELAQEAHAFLYEDRIPHCQCFIDHQNVRIDMSNHGKCQSHIHATGICFDRLL